MKLGKRQEDYLKALNTLDYYFEGAMVPYILLNETAQKMKNHENLDDLERLEIGVWERNLSKYARNTLRDRLGEEWMNKEHVIEGCKVYIKLIKRRYGFFKYLDKIPYWGGSFHTANPFDRYWRVRSIVK
jgi:hypothetical protein